MTPVQHDHSGWIRKLDTRLLIALGRRGHGDAGSDRVGASVVFTGELDALRRTGFDAPSMVQHPVRQVNIAAGSIALARVMDLAALDQVISIEAGYSMKPEIDGSVHEIGARLLHAGIGFLPPLKGAGVVVGIIDLGFDIRHKTFRNPDGTTRIIAMWDQTIGPPRDSASGPQQPLEPGEVSPAIPFSYGVEYSRQWINGFLGEGPSLGPVRTTDRINHGTPVAGIAAGNGLQPGNCHFAGHFVGVAPESNLIFVKIRSANDITDSKDVQHAFEYIFTHPLVTGRAVVVNFSEGDNLGPHDGTSALELAIDALLLSRPGRVVVKSAGNEGDSARHAEVPVSSAGENLQLRVGPEDGGTRKIEAWYPGTARLAVSVAPPGQPEFLNDVVAPGAGLMPELVIDPALPENEQTGVTIRSELNRPNNGNNLITIILAPRLRPLPAGSWTVRFQIVGAGATTAQVWLDNDGDKETHFISHMSSARTITTPGTAQQVITVGAYDSKGRKGELAAFSSHGPIDPALGETIRSAPDVVAPGVGITSAKQGDHETSCCECCVTAYKGEKDNTGTSVAAPHVTGVIALMLQRHPELAAAMVRQILRDTADRPAGFTGPRSDTELNSFGFGRVNAVAAVQNVPPFFGGPGPPPFALHRGGALPPATAFCAVVAGFTPFLQVIAALRRQVLSSSDGQLCAALVSRHFSEARGLIRSNRRVAVAWHRANGPRFLRNLTRTLIARETEGMVGGTLPDLPDGFDRFFSALARYGSANLRSDLEKHGDAFAPLVRQALHSLRSLEQAA